MPNWCNNKLIISHEDVGVINTLINKIDTDGELFNSILPMPDNTFRGMLGNDEREMCEREGIPNWYDWACDNWGTKWDACHMDWHRNDEHTITFDFDSAWSPPTGVYEELMKQGFDVEAYYVEYGCGFAGEWHCSVEDEQYQDISFNIYNEPVSQELDEVFDITATLAEWAEEEKEYA